MSTRYIYIFEDGSMYQTDTPPTDTDLASTEEGILSILEITDTSIKSVLAYSKLDLGEMKIVPDEDGPYHYPKSEEDK